MKRMKRVLSLALAGSMLLTLFAACQKSGGSTTPDNGGKTAQSEKPNAESKGKIKVAAIETGYGSDIWKEVSKAFTEQTGIEVDLISDKNLENVIGPSMQAGDFPDVIHLAVGRKEGLTEQFIKDHQIEEITDLLAMQVPGEDKKVSDKLMDNFVSDRSTSNPYADGKTYLAPMFYSPCGLFYNAGLFEQKGWKLPETWDDMWALAEESKKENISLFTYPTTGYFDAFLYSLMYEAGGEKFFFDATRYKEGIWDTDEAKTCFSIIEKLASYTHPTTPSQANDQDFTKNQQMILDNKALFMPNGNWIVGEMKDAPRADGFKWGMMALPAIKAGGDRYSYTFFEQAWMPAGAKNKDLGKQFMAFLYSDKAAEIFGKAGAVQPIKGAEKYVPEESKLFYQVYENGAKAAIGNFAPYKAVAGLGDTRKVFLDPVDSLVSGQLTADEWVKNIKESSDKMRENLQ